MEVWGGVRSEIDGADAGNLPLGLFADVSYTQAHQPLQSGDRFAIYTDGLVEAGDADRKLFGPRRLIEALNADARRPLQDVKYAVLDALRRHTVAPSDTMT